MLTLHVGLPKTASTFLQYELFKHQDRHEYVHSSGPLERALQRMVRAEEGDLPAIEQQIDALLPRGDVLISNENISCRSAEPWTGEGPTPQVLAARMARLRELAGDVRVILGVRRQDHWLASRYAESSKHFPTFSQQDFEQRVRALCRARSAPAGALRWLDFAGAHRALVEHLGVDNVLVLPHERIGLEPEAALRVLEVFLDHQGWVASYRAGTMDMTPRNVLAAGQNRWTMRSTGQTLRLDDELSARVLAAYRRSNRALARSLRLDLNSYGYAVRRRRSSR